MAVKTTYNPPGVTEKVLLAYRREQRTSGHRFHIDIFINANCFLIIIFLKQ